jgi:hypothetical protein
LSAGFEGSHNGGYEEFYLLVYIAAFPWKRRLTFNRLHGVISHMTEELYVTSESNNSRTDEGIFMIFDTGYAVA